MLRNQNKIYNDSNSLTQRKFVSPTQTKNTNPIDNQKNAKIEQYRSSQKGGILSKKQSDSYQRSQKNKSQASSNSNQVHPSRVSSKIQEGKTSRQSTSRSKQRKDYMVANLARFNRKKQEKRSESNTSQKIDSVPSRQQNKPKYIYTFKQQAKQRAKAKEQYSNPMSQIKPIKQQVKFQSIDTSQIRSNNTSVAISSSGRQIQINVVKPEDRYNIKSQISKQQSEKSISIREPDIRQTDSYMMNSVLQTNLVNSRSTNSLKRSSIGEGSRIQMQSGNNYEVKYSQQLVNKLKNERQQFTMRIRRFQSQKNELLQNLKRSDEQKYYFKGQVVIWENKCRQLDRQVQQLKQAAGRSGKQIQRTNNNNEKMFKELQERYNSLLMEYRAKIRQNGQFTIQFNQSQNKQQQLKKLLKKAQQQLQLFSKQNQKQKRIFETNIQQLKQKHEFQLKQIKIRASNKQNKQSSLTQSLNQFEREIASKDREIVLKQKIINDLNNQLLDKQQFQSLYVAKCQEIQNLYQQLNRNKDTITKLNNQRTIITQKYVLQAKQKEIRIKQLTSELSSLKNKGQMDNLSSSARTQLFSQTQSPNQGHVSFMELIKSQSQQTNKLRTELSQKQQKIHNLTYDNEQLRDRVRRIEQQNQLNTRTYSTNINNLQQLKDATQMMLKRKIASLQSARLPH